MISIIVCSIKPAMMEELRKNISETIGCPYEIIAYDNREKRFGLCRVYNDCASKAKYNYLTFIHEDVIFQTAGWGLELIKQFESAPNCGFIGLAGGKYVPKNFISWGDNPNHDRYNYYQFEQNANKFEKKSNNPDSEALSEVVTLDGVLLFTAMTVWERSRFDESTYKGFHLYDADVSVAATEFYKNYVCHTIDVKHLSAGMSISSEYYENLILFHKKWRSKLPIYLPSLEHYHITFGEAKEYANMRYLYKCMSKTIGKWRAFQCILSNNGSIRLIQLIISQEFGNLMISRKRIASNG